MVSLINVIFAVLLEEKFGERVISHLTQTPCPWPTKFPNLSPLDFWFWSIAMAELRKVKPADLEDLKQIVEGFAESQEEDKVKKVARTVKN